MGALRMSAGFTPNAMTKPIITGQVKPDGIDWACSEVHGSELFWRQLRYGDFDVSEMSLSSLIIARSRGAQDWTALPIFTTRGFAHTGIMVHRDSGIDHPKGLIGKRVGVPEYQQTSAVWSRAILQHEFDVSPEQMTWFMARPPALSHGGATAFTPPAGIDLTYLDEDDSIAGMLERGELDATLIYIPDLNLVDRQGKASGPPPIRPLFPDAIAEGRRYYASTGTLPVNHCVVVRTSVLEANPWVALNIYSAFLTAKAKVVAQAAEVLDPYRRIGALPADASKIVKDVDALPYGVANQRDVLDALAGYLLEQGLTERKVDVSEIFATNTLDV